VPRIYLFACLSLLAALLPCAFGEEQPTSVRKVGPDVHPPIAINSPAAQFPAESRHSNTSGICVVSLTVDVNGLPQNPTIIRCTDPMFEQTSLDAVMQYRFKPATLVHGGEPVPVQITVEISYRLGFNHREPPGNIKCTFSSPPGAVTSDPDGRGIYPLSKEMQFPQLSGFVSRGFFIAAFSGPDGNGCTVLMTLDAKGKPRSAKVEACDSPVLSKPAEDSLMKSKFTPALLNGNPVPVRFVIKLVYEGFETNEK
jgi:TonB family protein